MSMSYEIYIYIYALVYSGLADSIGPLNPFRELRLARRAKWTRTGPSIWHQRGRNHATLLYLVEESFAQRIRVRRINIYCHLCTGDVCYDFDSLLNGRSVSQEIRPGLE